ncbi:MAG: hypothetical protein GC168_09025 [Candidatus Hydrogenedens sp.]|nr:hypothetical protein [Candidatus Hydrogenedens sp.]
MSPARRPKACRLNRCPRRPPRCCGAFSMGAPHWKLPWADGMRCTSCQRNPVSGKQHSWKRCGRPESLRNASMPRPRRIRRFRWKTPSLISGQGMEYRIQFRKSFQRDLEDVHAYLREEAGKAVADTWLEEVLIPIEKLSSMPRRCPQVRDVETPWPDLRYFILGGGRGRYRILFDVSGDRVLVVRIVHCSRDYSRLLIDMERGLQEPLD